MPFKSLAQARLFFAAAQTPASKWRGGKRPKITLKKAKEWAEKTNWGDLPRQIAKLRANKKLKKQLTKKKFRA